MKNALNVAVFGLNLEALDQMKNQLLLSVPTDVNVQWVNISSNEIDLLLVNDMFLIHRTFSVWFSSRSLFTLSERCRSSGQYYWR